MKKVKLMKCEMINNLIKAIPMIEEHYPEVTKTAAFEKLSLFKEGHNFYTGRHYNKATLNELMLNLASEIKKAAGN